MDLAALETVIDVARKGGFSAVARAKGVEPSSVSRLVAAVEQEIGERLFQRTTRRLSLTEAGAAFLARVEPLVTEFAEATAEVRALGRGPVGTVRLSTSVAFGLQMIVPLLGRFRSELPMLKLELVMDDANLDLVGEGVDLAIRLAPSVRANVIASKLFDTRYHVVATRAWLDGHPVKRPEDLRERRVLRFALAGFRDRWLFRGEDGAVATVPVDGDLILSSPIALREAARAGLGPALLPNWLIGGDLTRGTLVDCLPGIRVTATDFATGAWLIYPSRTLLPMKVRATIDLLRRWCAAV